MFRSEMLSWLLSAHTLSIPSTVRCKVSPVIS